jgi:hypothetical protein
MNIRSLKAKIKKVAEALGVKLRKDMPCLVIHTREARTKEEQEQIVARETKKFLREHPELAGEDFPRLFVRCYRPEVEPDPYEFDDDGD